VSGGAGGSTTGSPRDIQTFKSLESLRAIRAGTGGRPTLIVVTLEVLPFQPQEIYLHRNLDPNSRTSQYLYWTNVDTSTGTGTVYRCYTNGERIETVLVTKGSRSLGLYVLSVRSQDYATAISAKRAWELTGGGDPPIDDENFAVASDKEYIDVIFFTQEGNKTKGITENGGVALIAYVTAPPIDDTKALYNSSPDPSSVSVSVTPTGVVLVPLYSPGAISAATGLSVDQDIINGYLFVSLLDGTVLRLELAYVFIQKISPPSLPPRRVISYPYWVNRISSPHSTARVTALSSTLPPPTPSPQPDYKQQRIFIIDSNQHELISSSEDGYSSTSIDLLSSGIVWPRAVSSVVDVDNISIIHLYIAETLGKIWTVDIVRDPTTGSFDRNIPSPRIIADMSSFPSSLAIREMIMLKTPQDTGSISNRVTLEIVY